MENVMKELESGDENRVNLSLSNFNEKVKITIKAGFAKAGQKVTNKI